MKSNMLITCFTVLITASTMAQGQEEKTIAASVAKLDRAASARDYQQLAGEFATIAKQPGSSWLPWYYAAYCNARTAWLYERDGDRIEPFARLAEEQARQSLSLIDTVKQRQELSELYCVLSMVKRAWVFINPMSYGRQYGPVAAQYIQKARQTNPANPRALYLEGWEKDATPKMWGGDKKKAKELLLQSLQLLDTQAATGVQPHWGRQEVTALLQQLK